VWRGEVLSGPLFLKESKAKKKKNKKNKKKKNKKK